MNQPAFVDSPFVLPMDSDPAERHGHVDLYLPASPGPWPAVVFIPGGPIPAELPWNRPRDWPVYRGYGTLLASHGAVAAPVQLRLHDYTHFPRAAEDLMQAIDLLRTDPRIDPDRIGIWFFCGGGPLIADWLRNPPNWLRCLAATYPVLGDRPGKELESRFQPAEALASAGWLPPIVLTRVGRENPLVAKTVEAFVAAAEECRVKLDIVDVPNGRHGFDFLDYTEESRSAVYAALNSVLGALQ